MRVFYSGRTEIWKCWFLWMEESRRIRRKPSEQGQNQQQTRPTLNMAPGRNRTRVILVRCERSHTAPLRCEKTSPTVVIWVCDEMLVFSIFSVFAVPHKHDLASRFQAPPLWSMFLNARVFYRISLDGK